jgi:hypothetical protein
LNAGEGTGGGHPLLAQIVGGGDEDKDEDGEEGEVTPPPLSLLVDIFRRQAGIAISVR